MKKILGKSQFPAPPGFRREPVVRFEPPAGEPSTRSSRRRSEKDTGAGRASLGFVPAPRPVRRTAVKMPRSSRSVPLMLRCKLRFSGFSALGSQARRPPLHFTSFRVPGCSFPPTPPLVLAQ
ncbi:hypothetical protein CoHVHLJ_120 [Columbid alphaherpesvirus 1]|uniref:Uncharacterized protein n=1 Tax=Columbid alphaherpesvirus 1 TaxID=93386 RepID=A0A1V0M8M1_9ALPH|nr:hypothetical protein CoHVHLJ_096 [Columbid alphaherpesvirus 1]YP_009353014.1 hypothetical protein CoHVHLJ_120 [Columbid alphaherpesvirus 1]ARD71407.1 hypothetical protein CoHVHLJ_096 [Columbid alphaherpesvirus 1]ARD71431.1 hypothetical protein CoHVHLJ_120 [Columbid alphaherpesvirus 1]